MDLNFRTMSLSDEDVEPIREALFDASQPGYFILRGFLEPAVAAEIVTHWAEAEVNDFKVYVGKYGLYNGCPNYLMDRKDGSGNRTFVNFFWNKPHHTLTYAAAQQAQMLRNRVEGHPQFREFFPLANRSAAFRISISRNGRVIVPAHRDWIGKLQDRRRTQMTLFLTEKGPDYTGDGFVLESNQGKPISFGTHVAVRPGDLAIWRYNNEHQVINVESSGSQAGFVRMTFPPEYIHPHFPFAGLGLPGVSACVAAAYQGRYMWPHRVRSWASNQFKPRQRARRDA